MFVAFEGIDGTGKTTLIKNVAQEFTHKAIARGQFDKVGTFIIREPGSTVIGGKIADLILNTHSKDIDPLVGNMLFSASRAAVVREFIIPHLKNGDNVFTDRYTPSTIAYGHFGLGTSLQFLRDLNQMSTAPDVVPDTVIYMRVTGKKNIQTVYNRRTKGNLRDMETLEFITRVVDGYERMYDGTLDNDALRVGMTWKAFNPLLPLNQLVDDISEYLLTS